MRQEPWRMFLSARCASALTKWALARPSAPVKSTTISVPVCAACTNGKKHSGKKQSRKVWHGGKMISPMQLV